MYTHIFTVFICLFFSSCSLSVFLSLSLSLTRPPFLPLSPLSKLLISEAPLWITVCECVCVCLHSVLKTVCTTDTDTFTQTHMIVSCYYVGSMLLFPRLSFSLAFHTHSVGFIRNTTRPFSFTPRLCCRNDQNRLLHLAEYIYTYIS